MAQVIRAYFNGMPCEVEFSLTLGISPGSGTITFADPATPIAKRGELIITDGVETTILHDMYATKPRTEQSSTGGFQRVATIYDKRFAWKWGNIVGRYNQRNYLGIPKEEVNLFNLLEVCLSALEVSSWDLITIPNVYPEVDWEFENPASAINDMCEKYGLVIGMSSQGNNPIIICPYDYERNFPLRVVESSLLGVTSDILPRGIVLVGNRKIMQQKFATLIAVGEDTDGSIKRIDDLSYAPTDWGNEYVALFSNLATDAQKQLAEKCIFKWYSIDWNAYNSDLVLPLLTELSELVLKEGEHKHRKPYVITQKTVWDGVKFRKNTSCEISDGFSVDTKFGIVKFNAPVISPKNEKLYSGGFQASIIDLYAAYESKNGVNSDFPVWLRGIVGGTELPVIFKDNSVVSYWIKNEVTGVYVEQNSVDLGLYATKVLDELQRMYKEQFPEIRVYAGIINLGAWGTFKSVTWSANENGATTEVQKYIEIPRPTLPSYDEKLQKRKMQALWESSKRLERVKKIYPYD